MGITIPNRLEVLAAIPNTVAVDKALIEMYLAGIFVRRAEDIAEAWAHAWSLVRYPI